MVIIMRLMDHAQLHLVLSDASAQFSAIMSLPICPRERDHAAVSTNRNMFVNATFLFRLNTPSPHLTGTLMGYTM